MTSSAMTSTEADAQYDPPLHVGWLSRKGLLLHLTMLFVVAGCTAATWWQLDRALGGNGLSWAYTFEWPCFAVFAVVLWWKILHDPVEDDGSEPAPRPRVSRPNRQAPPPLPDAAAARRAAARAEIERAAAQGDWHPA
jgi:hypothetical protein